jgi:hypothetical protein
MRAGLLREVLDIYLLKKRASETGAEKCSYTMYYRIRGYRKKLSASVGSGVNASEEFIGKTVVFQVRRNSFLNEDVRVRHNGIMYKVLALDLQPDNTYLMTCTKVNE